MADNEIHIAAAAIAVAVCAFVRIGTLEMARARQFAKDNPYTMIARHLDRMPNREWCDDNEARHRLFATGVVDRFSDEIKALWAERGGGNEPKFSLLDLGAAQLRISPKMPPATGFDSSAWSWDEADGLIRRNQADPRSKENIDRWRDLDSMVRFLIEKDYARLMYGKKFDAPDVTQHQFRPNPGVTRTGEKEFTVQLDPGDFKGREETLRKILEPEWAGGGYHVKILWQSGPAAYVVLAHHDSSRSFVNHRRRTLEIANLAWTKTVAHELGHVLGFDDHYYNVWNARNCYYSQESRLADIMSNSEHGSVTPRHWEVLNSAYPWKGTPANQPFEYAYGK